ncbi:MAG: GTPase Era [Fimbriimonadaceae bacterium]
MSHKFGMVAMIGKPNVGKSTLLNSMVGQKVSIVSARPQTTRRQVMGIVTGEGYQIAFIDTPGIHEPHTLLARSMVEQARQSLGDVDLVLYVADASKRVEELDKQIADLTKGLPVIVCLNKMDKLKPEFVVETVEAYCTLFQTEKYMMTVATQERNVPVLVDMIVDALPEGESMFDEDDFTDQPMRFMAAELIREKVLLSTREEVPHATAVRVESWEEEPKRTYIRAEIIVEKTGQRAILIGKGGQFLKDIGTKARLEIEALIGRPVFLELFVKVREDWRMNPRILNELRED